MHHRPDIMPSDEYDDEALFAALAGLPERRVPENLAASFRQRLTAMPSPRRGFRRVVIVGAAAMLLLAIGAGWWHERLLRLEESAQLHTQLATALQSLSDATRLRAINATVTDGEHGSVVEQALVTALLTDQSTNVRMAAAEALGRIARPAALGQAVRRALAQENSPFVQMTLLETTNRLAPRERRSAIAPILTREHIDPMVINDARQRTLEPMPRDSR